MNTNTENRMQIRPILYSSQPIRLQIGVGVGVGGSGQFDPPCGFSKNVSCKERVKPWFIVTLSDILRHISPENFIEFDITLLQRN